MRQTRNKTEDKLVSDLCEQIDYLEHRLEQVIEEKEHYRQLYNEQVSERIQSSYDLMGGVLMASIETADKIQE